MRSATRQWPCRCGIPRSAGPAASALTIPRRPSSVGLRYRDLAKGAIVLDADPFLVFMQQGLARQIGHRRLVVPAVDLVIFVPASRRDGRCPGACVNRGVRDLGYVVVALAVVVEDVALDDVHVVTGEVAGPAEQRLGVVVGYIDNQRVAFPVPAGIG